MFGILRDRLRQRRAQELADPGLLAGGTPRIALPPREALANTLQATMSWAPAEQIAAGTQTAQLTAAVAGTQTVAA